MCVSTLITIWPGTGLNLLFHSRRSQLPDIYQNNVVTIHNHFKDFSITFLRIYEVKKNSQCLFYHNGLDHVLCWSTRV